MNYKTDDTEILDQNGGDVSRSEPWQPDYTANEESSPSYIPLSTDVSIRRGTDENIQHGYNHENNGQVNQGYSYDINGQDYPRVVPDRNRTTADDDELLVPPDERYGRHRWEVRSEPYQTTSSDYRNYPRVPSQLTANNFTQSNVVVVQPGISNNFNYAGKYVSNNTAFSVFVSLLCCLPIGLCAFFFARDSQTMWLLGHRDEAKRRARISLALNITGLIIGLILIVAVIVSVFTRV